MSHGSVIDVPEQTRCHGLDVICNYEVPDETLSILLAIVQDARKSEERHTSEAA